MTRRQHTIAIALVALCAIVTYIPILWFPFIADDYGQIPMARGYGSPSGWTALFQDSAFRFRFTYVELMWLLDRLFGFTPAPFYATSIALHALCSVLVYATGAWRLIGYRVALPAAVFFAVYEGHQEAVMWVAASMELLQFTFVIATLLCWLRWTERPRAGWYIAAIVSFCAALLSKESAVVTPALMALPLLLEPENRRRNLLSLLPFAALAAAALVISLGTGNARMHDGSFSFSAPFLRVFVNSYWRLFWIWGLLGAVVLALRREWPLLRNAAIWTGLSLGPYVFLTYMERVPSRHTYLASLGVSWIVGAAWVGIAGRRLAVLLAGALLTQNVATIWVKKRRQFLERAEPTERLIRIVQSSPAPVRVRCFPYNVVLARLAAESVGKTIKEDLRPDCGVGEFDVLPEPAHR